MSSLIGEAFNPQRLISRVKHYAAAAGASEAACGQMLEMLQSPVGQAVLALPQQELDSLLVNDMYKIRMQNMYSQFMTGVCADFALNVRSIKGGDGSISAATVLSDMRENHPKIYSALLARVCVQMQQLQPLDSRVLHALLEFHQGFVPPEALSTRLAAAGVAPIAWTDVGSGPVAVGSGQVDAASNTETSCMQAVQAAIIAAAAGKARSSICTSKYLQLQPQEHSGCGQMLLDRTERLASSLGKMVATVEQINNLKHDFSVLLMAGRRSTDLMHLLLQNLYFMQRVRGYVGTSSLLACSLLREVLVAQGMHPQQRQHLVKGLLGTHAHEMTSITQQLMVSYDEAAGRACGMNVPVCVSQLLSHLLFLVANGDQIPTALPDTFTTPYFVQLALLCTPPEEFVQDMLEKWAINVPLQSKVFDLFRVWRLDSGDYSQLAECILNSWQQRCEERQAEGLQALPKPQLMHSNIDSVDDIRQLMALPEHLRPTTLGFGGLADGFLPFEVPHGFRTAAAAATAGAMSHSSGVSSSLDSRADLPHLYDAADASNSGGSHTISLPVASLVMKAVQARMGGCSSSCSQSSAAGEAAKVSAAAAADANAADQISPLATASTTAAAAACRTSRGNISSSSTSSKLLGAHLQECAVKLGDDAALSKAQLDPRLPACTQQEVLGRMTAMVQGADQLRAEHAAVLSEVLSEAYVAVVRKGLLNAQP